MTSDGSGVLATSTVTTTELGYLAGVTSAIQTQFTNTVTTNTSQTIVSGSNKAIQSIFQFQSHSGSGGGADYTGGIQFLSDSTVANSGGIANISVDTVSGGMTTAFTANSLTLSKYNTYLGIGTVSSTTNGSVLTRNGTTNVVSLELLSDMGAGSSLILADRTTGTRYELYVDSGVLKLALA